MKIQLLKNLPLAVASVTVMIATGCATSGYKKADKTGAGIAEFHDEIANGMAAIDATIKSLNDVAASASTDPRAAFTQYSKDVSNLESAANKIRSRAETMQQRGQAYFAQWEEEIATVSNPEIRQLAEQRKARLQESFASIKQHTEPLKGQFDPWMSDLKDLESYLSNDLTIAGVDAAKTLFKQAINGGTKVQQSMSALMAELNTIAATLTPAKVEPVEEGEEKEEEAK